MDVKQAIKKYMEPFLKENGFVFVKSEKGVYLFHHHEHTELKVYFTVRTGGKGISCELKHGKTDLLPSYDLAIFFDDLADVEPGKRDGFWYYDTDLELIGALEEQAELLSKYGFHWLFNRLNVDIDVIIKTKAEEQKRIYDSSSEEQRSKDLNELLEERNQWINRRVMPNRWTEK